MNGETLPALKPEPEIQITTAGDARLGAEAAPVTQPAEVPTAVPATPALPQVLLGSGMLLSFTPFPTRDAN